MTQPAQAQITGGAPAQDQSIEAILGEELKDLRKEVDSLVQHGLSEEEAKGLLDWAAELEGKIKAVAAVLENPSPETISRYLRHVAAGIASSRSRRYAASSLRLLQAALVRASEARFTRADLKKKSPAELDRIARNMGIRGHNKGDKSGMIEAILKRVELKQGPDPDKA